MNPAELKGALEAIIYAADEPATLDQLAAAVGAEKTTVRAALDELVAGYAADDRGIEMRHVAGGFKIYTKAQHHEAVRRFIKSLRPPLRLTVPALETLAIIAYKQPVTLPEIHEIRGVNCAGVVQTLLERRLITTAGRKHVLGRPILYRTTKDFLMRFGLSDVDELPSVKEFEQLARAALGADEGIAVEEGNKEQETAEAISEQGMANRASEQHSPAVEPQPLAGSEREGNSEQGTGNSSSEPHSPTKQDAPITVEKAGNYEEQQANEQDRQAFSAERESK